MKILFFLILASSLASARAEEIPLSAVVTVRDADQEQSRPVLNHNTQNKPLLIGGQERSTGVGTQVDTRLAVTIAGATHFSGLAGVDDATGSSETIRFEIFADGQSLWHHELKKGDPAARFDLDLVGKKQLVLVTADIGNNYSQALADWADAKFAVEGDRPKSAVPPSLDDQKEILTPPAPATPRINGARVFGVRPRHPFLFQVPATGDRPMKFAAENLPVGLTIDESTGRITGVLIQVGSSVVTLRATNALGRAESRLRIEVGEKIALTPPMGWNSWNSWATAVDQEKVLASARAMASTGLINHGWSYLNIDDTWQGRRDGPAHALQGNDKFPDLKALCNQIHALGLKAGIYSTPWITSYATYPGGSADNPEGNWEKPQGPKHVNRKEKPWALGEYTFASADAKQWADWGIDYLKYDWSPNEPPETEEMATALRNSGRDIVLSLSNNAPYANAPEWARLANAWRTTGDIRDSWGSLRGIWFQQEKWRPYAGPGHWNDPDMLVVGNVGWGPKLHASRLTANEQYSHISLWCLLSAPLLIGCPIEQMDKFTLSLLTNDEVLAIDQDELGRPATQVVVDGRKQIYLKELSDGSWAIGLFNLAPKKQEISIKWRSLKFSSPQRVRDIWQQKDLSADKEVLSAIVNGHGTVLLRAWTRTTN